MLVAKYFPQDPKKLVAIPTMNSVSSSCGLRILRMYDSDSENEESRENGGVPITKSPLKRSNQSCEPADKAEKQCKRQKFEDSKFGDVPTLLPVPNKILEMFSKPAEEDASSGRNDPSLHKGRIRSFPHVRGNWASYIYVPCDTPVMNSINDMIMGSWAEGNVENLAIHQIDDKHLSLSRTQPFRHHWIEPFVEGFTEALKGVPRMNFFLDKFEVYVNDEKTRTFIGVNVIPSESLLRSVEICDKCLSDFQLEPYYKDPSFHISCAWVLGNEKRLLEEKLLPIVNKKWATVSDTESSVIPVDRIEFKTGNMLYQFALDNG